LKNTRLALTLLLAATSFTAFAPAHAQPIMGEMGMHHDEGRHHERVGKHWEKRQTALKAKLQLTAAQEPAWHTFVEGMKVPANRLGQAIERDALAKLSTPERLEKMTALHETNLAVMQTHIKQRAEATRAFYAQLNVAQQKVFDAETLPEQSRRTGKDD
jgi:protein CpxP